MIAFGAVLCALLMIFYRYGRYQRVWFYGALGAALWLLVVGTGAVLGEIFLWVFYES